MGNKGIKSRKRSFWAFLLSFVLIVGLLPEMPISADSKTFTFVSEGADPDGFVVGTVLNVGDVIKNGTPTYSPPTLTKVELVYQDYSGAQIKDVIINNGDLTHDILSYSGALGGAAGELDGHVSDVWTVSALADIDNINYPTEYGNCIFKKIELKAVPKYTIEYDKNGGTFGPLPTEFIPEVTGEIDVTPTGSISGTKTGHTFVKWKGVLRDGDNTYPSIDDYNVECCTDSDHIKAANAKDWARSDTVGYVDDYKINLKAIFDPNDYQIVLNTNLGTASTTTTLPTVGTWLKYGTVPSANAALTTLPSDASKTFKGWALKADATSPDAFCTFDANNNVNPAKLDDIVNAAEAAGSGATITRVSPYSAAQSARKKITLYAIWETPNYNITFDVQGKGNAVPAVQNLSYGSVVTPPAEPTEYGYSIEGWYTEAVCTNKWNFATDTVTGARTLYANWVPNDYTVKFDANAPADFSGNPVANPADLTKKFGQNLDITYPALQDGADYEFLGWALENDAAIPDLAITYPSEAKTVKLDDVVKDAESDATIGTTYKSSYNDPTTGRNVNIYDLTLYGVWRKKSYTVNFVDGNGTVIGSQVYAYGTPANTVKTYADTLTPTKAADADYNYTFAGWDKDFAAVTANATYTATFNTSSKNSFTVTFVDGNGNVITTQVYARGTSADTVKALAETLNPQKTDTDIYFYIFDKWDKDFVDVTADITYTAKFLPVPIYSPDPPSPSPSLTPTPDPQDPKDPQNPPKPSGDPEKDDDDDDDEEIYNITYYVLGDEPDLNTGNPATYVAGVGCKIPNGVSLANHKFVGWFTARNGGVAVDVITDEDTGDKELYARFDEADDDGKASIFLDDIEGGLVGSAKFTSLMLRLTDYKKDSITLKWKLQKGADGYDIYGSKCNSGGVIRTYEYIDTVYGDKDTFKAENLEEGTYYKFYIESFVKKPNGEKVIICRSVLVHGTTLSKDFGVADSVKVTEDEITLEVGETYQIQAIEIINDKTKTIKSHRPICYETSNRKVKVGKYTGLVTAKRVGKSWVYVYAQNGLYTRVLVNIVAKGEKQ